ncbi:hypothetical protein OC842_004230 [Tilletia horrida]|uniref:Uncharacterized protein n=1 Tax=Tilletia horrida TaxID=155126 RepID=A0AAN6GCH1_9BASI|nr:hypothetical protein OC842_004230 [Tilletia horrida]
MFSSRRAPILVLGNALLVLTAAAQPQPQPQADLTATVTTSTSSSPSSAVIPLLVLQGSSFVTPAPTPTSTASAADNALTASIIGQSDDDATTTYLLGCSAQDRDASCDGLPAGVTFTLTAAPSGVNQTYTNRQLLITYSQQCTFPPATASASSSLPSSALCTLAFSGLPPSHSEQTLTLSVDHAADFFRTVAVVADNVTSSSTPTTSTSTAEPTTSTAQAVTSTSVYVVTPPSMTTQVITVTPPASSSSTATGGGAAALIQGSTATMCSALALALSTSFLLGVVLL